MKLLHKILDICIKKNLDFNYDSVGLTVYEHKPKTKMVGYVFNSSDTFDEDMVKLLEKLKGME